MSWVCPKCSIRNGGDTDEWCEHCGAPNVRELLEHASRQNLCDKGMPWPQNHAEIADWILAMDLSIVLRALHDLGES